MLGLQPKSLDFKTHSRPRLATLSSARGVQISFPDSCLPLLEGPHGGADSLILAPGNKFNSWQKESTYSNSEQAILINLVPQSLHQTIEHMIRKKKVFLFQIWMTIKKCNLDIERLSSWNILITYRNNRTRYFIRTDLRSLRSALVSMI